jgi:MFS family permease
VTTKTFSKKSWIILILFGIIGQIAWSVENMYFNLFVFKNISPDLSAITLMVQLSGVVATVVTLFVGTLSDKIGNRRAFISYGYIIWGVTVALFGFISPSLMASIFGVDTESAIRIALTVAIVGDCVMTLFGSSANDAAYNAWVTDNTSSEYRGKVEGVVSILPLIAMLIVAGGFGILVEAFEYSTVFLFLGIIISISGIYGRFTIKDNPTLSSSGSMKDIFYGFKISSVKRDVPFYLTLVIVLIYGIACQVFMPYMIIYMQENLGFEVIEYSLVFGIAIIGGALINLYLTRLSDRCNKVKMLYIGTTVFALGLLGMYFAKGISKIPLLILFGVFGLVMISGYIFISALSGAIIRDNTREGSVGKLQGVRMVFAVLIPMIVGPMIGNAINAARNIPISSENPETAMTTLYIPAPEIFLAASIISLLLFPMIFILDRRFKKKTDK